MKKILAIAAALLLTSTQSHAVPTTWELLNNQRDVVGTFLLDLDTGTTSNVQIAGDLDFYTRSSTFTRLNTATFVDGYPVTNYFKFFSTRAGTVYRYDLGGGDYSEVRVNDAAIDIGTRGVLSLAGGLYDAFIHEIYNFDEIISYCAYYEEIYDDEGNYIGEGPCALRDSYGNYNIEGGYSYEGYFLRSAPIVTGVPLPSTAWLLLAALAGLGAKRLRRTG
ncbi:MAG: hypothetical protein KDI33_18245 [Halioglobus sp.]|nr:hypothetical protein [Halioglobus sp.]